MIEMWEGVVADQGPTKEYGIVLTVFISQHRYGQALKQTEDTLVSDFSSALPITSTPFHTSPSIPFPTIRPAC